MAQLCRLQLFITTVVLIFAIPMNVKTKFDFSLRNKCEVWLNISFGTPDSCRLEKGER